MFFFSSSILFFITITLRQFSFLFAPKNDFSIRQKESNGITFCSLEVKTRSELHDATALWCYSKHYTHRVGLRFYNAARCNLHPHSKLQSHACCRREQRGLHYQHHHEAQTFRRCFVFAQHQNIGACLRGSCKGFVGFFSSWKSTVKEKQNREETFFKSDFSACRSETERGWKLGGFSSYTKKKMEKVLEIFSWFVEKEERTSWMWKDLYERNKRRRNIICVFDYVAITDFHCIINFILGWRNKATANFTPLEV